MSGELSAGQIAHYREHGWVAPIDVLSKAEAAELLASFEQAESDYPEALHSTRRNNAHLAFPFLDDIVRREEILDPVRSLVGEDLFLWSTVLFVKEPNSNAYVSWHQDSTYVGVDGSQNFVTAWLALTPSTVENGCVSVIPGTHIGGIVPHEDRYGADNILTRGQEVPNVAAADAIHLELRPGQMSLHHPWLVHGSQPNPSNHRRIGFAMQSYMGHDVVPTRGTHHVTHICGEPVPVPFVDVPRPEVPCGAREEAARLAAEQAFADVLYEGAEHRRDL